MDELYSAPMHKSWAVLENLWVSVDGLREEVLNMMDAGNMKAKTMLNKLPGWLLRTQEYSEILRSLHANTDMVRTKVKDQEIRELADDYDQLEVDTSQIITSTRNFIYGLNGMSGRGAINLNAGRRGSTKKGNERA